jgi:hypothetical protein
MKFVITLFGLVSSILAGLFLYQNWTRAISQDSAGNYLSLDLYLAGVVSNVPISVSEIVIYSFGIGVILGLVLPQMVKTLKSPTYH